MSATDIRVDATEAEINRARKLKKVTDDYRLLEIADDQLRILSEAVNGELARRYTVETARERVEQAAEDYAKAVKGKLAVKIAELQATAALGPGESFIDAQEVEWVNQSGAWLSPHSAGPDSYPAGWRKAKAPAANAGPPWKPGDKVNAGDLRAYEGVVYKCLQAHMTQAGWEPDKVPALWAIA